MNTQNTNTKKPFNYPTLEAPGYYFLEGKAIINNSTYNFKAQSVEIASLEEADVITTIKKEIMISLRKNPLTNELQHFTVTNANFKMKIR